LILATIAAACATTAKRRAGVTDAVLSRDKAIVVISTSSDVACYAGVTYIQLIKVGEQGPEGWGPVGELSLNNDFVASDFTHRYGQVDAFVVEPGHYVVTRNILLPNIATYAVPQVREYEIGPGQVRYLGDMHGFACYGTKVLVRDEWQAVKSKFAERFPRVDLGRVIVEPDLAPPGPANPGIRRPQAHEVEVQSLSSSPRSSTARSVQQANDDDED
jgi:hypothetical protein